MKFQEYGILREMTQQQRFRRFMYTEYFAMFAAEEISLSQRDTTTRDIDLTQSKT